MASANALSSASILCSPKQVIFFDGFISFSLLLAAKTESFDLTLIFFLLFFNRRNYESLVFFEFLMGVDDCRGV